MDDAGENPQKPLTPAGLKSWEACPLTEDEAWVGQLQARDSQVTQPSTKAGVFPALVTTIAGHGCISHSGTLCGPGMVVTFPGSTRDTVTLMSTGNLFRSKSTCSTTDWSGSVPVFCHLGMCYSADNRALASSLGVISLT